MAELARARSAVATMTDAELAGQVIVARYVGTDAPTRLVSDYHLGGVIVMPDNVESVDQVMSSNTALQAADDRSWPLVIGVDQEGGSVARLGAPMTEFPSYMGFGAADHPALASKAAKASGEELRAAGFTMVYAPVADVTIGRTDPTIGSRSAGDDPNQVAALVASSTQGYLDSGIIPVVKHFPGHGSVTADSHQTLPVQSQTLQQLSQRDFKPFKSAVFVGVPAVMVGHLSLEAIDPGVPADLSAKDIALLRDEFRFEGLVTTDALEMAAVTDSYTADNAAVEALTAGVDLLLMPADVAAAHQGIVDALSDGSLPRERVEDAAAKIVALMMHQARAHRVRAATIGSHHQLSYDVSARAVTVVQGRCTGPYVARAVDPAGDPEDVAGFTAAAKGAGLKIADGGTRVTLLGFGASARRGDIVVALDTPYPLTSSRARVAKIALYGDGPEAMRALVDVLTGKLTPRGSLPVSVQGLDQQRNC